MRYLFGFILVFSLGAMGCSETPGTGGSGGVRGDGGAGGVDSPYASEELWLCRPDIETDQCDLVDLSFTEIRPDGTQVTGDVVEDPNAEVDCFYVYHTVIGEAKPGNPGNMETLSPTDPAILRALHRDGVHFREMCRMFAPLYHQMTLSTYYEFSFSWRDTEYFQRAYGDVVEAFEYYMREHNDGRDFVLVGHSQGISMLAALLKDQFDDDDALRGQLISAVFFGAGGAVSVPNGEQIGGTYANIPLCTSAEETGCVIAYDGVAAGVPSLPDTNTLPPSGMGRACVNPASLGNGSDTLTALTFPRSSPLGLPFPDGVDTEWVRYPNVYASSCGGAPQHLLQVDVASNPAQTPPFTPQELQAAIVEHGYANNLHAYGETFATMADLVRIVEQQIASRGN